MSMEHKAFAFDWLAFSRDLSSTLLDSLATQREAALLSFIDSAPARFRDPYEGEPLTADWRSRMETGDLQEIADFTLTAFYDPSSDRGLAADWHRVADDSTLQSALLGRSFGPDANLFDPGRTGSYFQSPDDVRESLSLVRNSSLLHTSAYCTLLEECSKSKLGVYVTF